MEQKLFFGDDFQADGKFKTSGFDAKLHNSFKARERLTPNYVVV